MNADPTRAHCQALLAPVYRWIGDFSAALERSRSELSDLGIGPACAGARGLDAPAFRVGRG